MKPTPEFTSKFKILKKGRVALALSATLSTVTLSLAAPSGGVVSSGSATIEHSGKVTNINQVSDKASINWQKFGIKSDEVVNFKQPDINSITLNRVVGNERSVIDGALNANGQIWILNSNGVLFGKNAKINTAGLLATTKELSDTDFQAGEYSFKGDSTASVINMGTIDISDSGYAVLLADSVTNEGEIKAIKGTLHLTGAKEATINLNGNSLVDLVVDKGVLDALVENRGAIYADGGEIYLTTNAADELLKGVVNNEGIIEANSMEGITGHVELFAHGGTGEFGGTIEADGGFIETSGAIVNLKENLTIKASGGEWLIDPYDYTIDATAAGHINTALNGGTSVTVETTANSTDFGSNGNNSSNGDITVASDITKTSGGEATLTLKAERNIIMNADTSITSSSDKLNTILWADADGNENGSIYLKDGSSINTNGGHLWMGGGDGSTTWNGLTVGDDYAYAGTAHSVTLGSALNYQNGISFSNVDITSSGGNIALYGKSKNQTAISQGYIGILFDKSTISSGDGNIDISAISESTAANASWYYGLLMTTYQNNLTSSIASSGGDITIVGETSFQEDSHGAGVGLYGWNNTNSLVEIRSNGGNIDVTGRLKSTGFNTQYGGIFLFGNSQENIVSQTGNIELNGFSANPNVYGINVASGNDSAKIGYDGTNPYSGDITLNSDTKINFEGSIVADTLNLLGNGVTYTLQSTQNDVNTLTANTGKVTFIDKDSLTLGAITTTDTINIATLTDDLTINGNIATTSTADDAITLNAGKNTAAGTSTGGDIIYTSGTITTGANGRTTLYSGSYTSGNSFDSLVSSNDYRKFNSDETTIFDPALGSGRYLVYRENTTPDPTPAPTPSPEPTPTPTPSPEPTPSPTVEKEVETEREKVDQVIITIVNQEATKPPKIETPSTQGLSINDIGSNVDINPDVIGTNTLISQPIEGQDTKKVSMSEAKAMQIESGGGDGEVRVPLSRDSMIELVDGGVSLPEGVEQEFYVADEE